MHNTEMLFDLVRGTILINALFEETVIKERLA